MSARETAPHTILIINYGSQYADLLLRKCRECAVYHKMYSYDVDIDLVKDLKPCGLILSGGPGSVFEEGAVLLKKELWSYASDNKIPIFGICYGMQDMHQHYNGQVSRAEYPEYGPAELTLNEKGIQDPLFHGIPSTSSVWMSHHDAILKQAPNSNTLATTQCCDVAASSDCEGLKWAVQFHPEVMHTQFGKKIFENFIHRICKVPKDSWPVARHIQHDLEELKNQIGSHHVFGAISGGTDSLVAAAMVSKAIQRPFYGFCIDTGLLRKDETKDALDVVTQQLPFMKLRVIDASHEFYDVLKGVLDPDEKRKRIGHLFIEVLTRSIQDVKIEAGCVDSDDAMLLQGTVCSDVIESSTGHDPVKGQQRQIKIHHNVGGLPEKLNIKLLEPLRRLFKDEVLHYGTLLNLRPETLQKQPFPGPGFAIRIVGEVTRERVQILRAVDAIFVDELKRSSEYSTTTQAFAILLPDCRSVGIAGDERTYGMTVALRAIDSKDYMTATCCPLSFELLQKVSSLITNEVPEVTRVVYDITSKPPGTIEWL